VILLFCSKAYGGSEIISRKKIKSEAGILLGIKRQEVGNDGGKTLMLLDVTQLITHINIPISNIHLS
jgi:hypothetical protein